MSTRKDQRATKATTKSSVTREAQRRRLFAIAGVIAVARGALASKLEVDDESVIDALAVAANMVADIADAL